MWIKWINKQCTLNFSLLDFTAGWGGGCCPLGQTRGEADKVDRQAGQVLRSSHWWALQTGPLSLLSPCPESGRQDEEGVGVLVDGSTWGIGRGWTQSPNDTMWFYYGENKVHNSLLRHDFGSKLVTPKQLHCPESHGLGFLSLLVVSIPITTLCDCGLFNEFLLCPFYCKMTGDALKCWM